MRRLRRQVDVHKSQKLEEFSPDTRRYLCLTKFSGSVILVCNICCASLNPACVSGWKDILTYCCELYLPHIPYYWKGAHSVSFQKSLNQSILSVLRIVCTICASPKLAFVTLLLKEDDKIFGDLVVSLIFSMAQERRKFIFVKRVGKHDFHFFDRCLPLIPPFKMLGHSLSTRRQSLRWIFSIYIPLQQPFSFPPIHLLKIS